jgi:hypothetical protein
MNLEAIRVHHNPTEHPAKQFLSTPLVQPIEPSGDQAAVSRQRDVPIGVGCLNGDARLRLFHLPTETGLSGRERVLRCVVVCSLNLPVDVHVEQTRAPADDACKCLGDLACIGGGGPRETLWSKWGIAGRGRVRAGRS